MENIRDLFKSFTEEDYCTRVNLHIHTNLSDGEGECFEILESAKKQGYKFISITDHNTVEAHKLVKDDILITGVEFDCWYGCVFIHLLGYGIDVDHPDIEPFLAKTKKDSESVLPRLFSKRNVRDLISAIHKAGGIAVLAHPACYWALNLEGLVKKLIEIGLDGIEVYYPYPRFRSVVKFHSSENVVRIAEKYPELIKTGGTDFHEKVF